MLVAQYGGWHNVEVRTWVLDSSSARYLDWTTAHTVYEAEHYLSVDSSSEFWDVYAVRRKGSDGT